jgi:hypothetical protein
VPGQPAPRPGIYLPSPEIKLDASGDVEEAMGQAGIEMVEAYRYSKVWNSVLRKMIGFLETIKSTG